MSWDDEKFHSLLWKHSRSHGVKFWPNEFNRNITENHRDFTWFLSSESGHKNRLNSSKVQSVFYFHFRYHGQYCVTLKILFIFRFQNQTTIIRFLIAYNPVILKVSFHSNHSEIQACRSIRASTCTPPTWMPHSAEWRCSQQLPKFTLETDKSLKRVRITEDKILSISLLQPLLFFTITSKGGIFWLYLRYLFAFSLKFPFSLKIISAARQPHHFWASCLLCVLVTWKDYSSL